MKKVSAIAMALMLCLSVIALADQPNPSTSQAMGKKMEGTITKVDAANKTLTIRENSGTEVTVFWDESTQQNGDLKEGASVRLEFADRDGRKVATSIDAKSPVKKY
jgi:Cu/Ag efflux protein CusF